MYDKVLVPLDGSPLAECVLPHVTAIAQGCRIPSIILARVVNHSGIPVVSEVYSSGLQAKLELAREQMEIEERNQASTYLERIASRLYMDRDHIQTAIIEGKDASKSLLEYAEENRVDLIIIASHGRSGISRWAWGSVAERILRGGCVPMVMVRAPGCLPGTGRF